MESLRDFFIKNPEFLLDKTRLRNALHDYYQADIRTLNLMVLAYNHLDMLSQLQKDHPHIDSEKRTWIKSLSYAYSINERTITKTVNQWISVFCDDLKKRLKELSEERHNVRKQTADTLYQIRILIEDKKYNEAEELLNQIEQTPENKLIYTELLAEITKYNKTARTKVQEMAIQQFGDGCFGTYQEGIKIISSILDAYPDFLQAQIWLKDHPRETQVRNVHLSTQTGERRCTLTWVDDDPYTMYTVCRAVDHCPQDPNDGYCVCSEITNKQITDDLPADQPGVIWRYSIFAVRILDKQWKRTECKEPAVWIPNPTDVKAEVEKNSRGHPVVRLSWKSVSGNCLGVNILRYDNDNNNFDYSSEILNVDSREPAKQQAQVAGFYLDEVNSGITYRYVIQQVWNIGQRPLLSAGVKLEKMIP